MSWLSNSHPLVIAVHGESEPPNCFTFHRFDGRKYTTSGVVADFQHGGWNGMQEPDDGILLPAQQALAVFVEWMGWVTR